jgi:hypothetical protein
LEQPDQVLEQDTLATTTSADDDHRLTPMNIQGNSSQDLLGPEALGDVSNLDHGF